MSRRIAAIVNPVSGHRRMDGSLRAIAEMVRSAGAVFDLYETRRPGHATDIAAGLHGRADALLAVGGDGTVCEIANGLDGRRLPIAILQNGTENLLARELNMPTDPPSVTALLLAGRAFPHDVGVLNGRKFLAVAGVGFDGLCAHRMAAIRQGHITHLSYFWPVVRSFLDYPFPELTVVADGNVVFRERGFVIMGIIPRYSLGLRIPIRAASNDGLLDVCMFRCRSKVGLMTHAARVFAGKHLDHPAVSYEQCRSVRIECEEAVPIQVDGEPGGFAPAEGSLMPGAVFFLFNDASVRTGDAG